jgi:hypothetical protein
VEEVSDVADNNKNMDQEWWSKVLPVMFWS